MCLKERWVRRLPKPIIDRLNAALEKALSEQSIVDRFADLGTVPFRPDAAVQMRPVLN
jgi:hypothetical protein